MSLMRFFLCLLAVCCGVAGQSREGWVNAIDGTPVLEDRGWQCAGVTRGGGGLQLGSTSGFRGVVNSYGPRLEVSGDFSVVATFANATDIGGWVELEGQKGNDPAAFWRGLRKVDFGVVGTNASLVIWNGLQDSPVVGRNFAIGATRGVDVTLELARVGKELVLYQGTRELGRVGDQGVFDGGEARFGLLVAQGNTITLKGLRVGTPAGAETTVMLRRVGARRVARSGEGLRDLSGIAIGASVATGRLESATAYETLGREFNMVVAGNAMKWDATEPARGVFNFCEADRLVEFAEANGQQVRGHVLVWGLQLPGWVTNGTWTRETLLEAMRAHIRELVLRYKGRIVAWDVVNEALEDSPPHNLKQNVFTRVIGQDYLDFAFRYAREADAEVKLFYNDYGAERMNSKANAVLQLVNGMKSRGVPVDGVGLQMHYGLTGTMPAAEVEQNIRRLGQAGFEVHVTEMDIMAPLPDTAAKQNEQAEIYRGLYRACRAVAQCTAFLTWGVDDSDSWILTFLPGNFGGLLFDGNGWRKPAYYALQSERGGRRAASPVVARGGVVSAASFGSDPALSEGSFFSVFGSDFASRVTDWSAGFVDGEAPRVLDGVRVLVDGVPAYLALVTPGQINAIAPAGIRPGTREVIVERNAQPSGAEAVKVGEYAPAVFLFAPRGARYVAGISGDGTALIGPGDLFGGPVEGRAVRPARVGETVLLYGTGLGRTTPGTGVGRLPVGVAGHVGVKVRIGGVEAVVDYAGRSAFPGVSQLNVRVPQLATGEHEVVVEVGGVVSAAGKVIAVVRE
jgi:endo-1,4-beta-xylanase